MQKKQSHAKVLTMVRMAVLVAIIFLLTFANIGYITLGPIAFTIIQIPVILGAILMGPTSGAVLGFFFGLTSFLKALEGVEPVAAAIIAQNIFLYALIAFVPRILMGWLTGWVFKGLRSAENKLMGESLIGRSKVFSYAISGFVGSMFNTVFYLGSLYLLVKDILSEVYAIEVGAVGAMVLGVATSTGVIEAIASMIIATALAKAFEALFRKS